MDAKLRRARRHFSIALLAASLTPFVLKAQDKPKRIWTCGQYDVSDEDILQCNKASCDSYRSDSFQALKDKCQEVLRLYSNQECKVRQDSADPATGGPFSPITPPDVENPSPPHPGVDLGARPQGSQPEAGAAPPLPAPSPTQIPSKNEPPPQLSDCVPATT